MELKIRIYEKNGKRYCYMEDADGNGQEYQDVNFAWIGEMVTELFTCMEAIEKSKNVVVNEVENPYIE